MVQISVLKPPRMVQVDLSPEEKEKRCKQAEEMAAYFTKVEEQLKLERQHMIGVRLKGDGEYVPIFRNTQ